MNESVSLLPSVRLVDFTEISSLLSEIIMLHLFFSHNVKLLDAERNSEHYAAVMNVSSWTCL